MADQSKSVTFCPYLDKFGKGSCRLADSGLFIPTRKHILRFCENELYVKCYHYEGKSSLQDILVENKEKQFTRNRRFFTRIQTSQKLSLSRYSIVKGTSEDLLDNQAIAVDLSLGGMRIETDAPINVNQIISFTFDENFSPPGYKGKAEVRWINQYKSQAISSNAGLAFVDPETIDIVRKHLMGMGEKLLHLSGS